MRGYALLAALLFVGAPALPAHADGRSASASTVAALAGTLAPSGEGRRDFLKLNCYGCHGMRAAGGMGPNVQQSGLGNVRDVLLNGGDFGMPSFRKYVISTDIANINAYLNSIGTRNEPTWVDWWNPVP